MKSNSNHDMTVSAHEAAQVEASNRSTEATASATAKATTTATAPSASTQSHSPLTGKSLLKPQSAMPAVFARCSTHPPRHYMLLRVSLVHPSTRDSQAEPPAWLESAAQLHSLLHLSLCESYGLIGAASMQFSVIAFVNSKQVAQQQQQQQQSNNSANAPASLQGLSLPLVHACSTPIFPRCLLVDSVGGVASQQPHEETVCAVVCCDAHKLTSMRSAFMLYGKHSNLTSISTASENKTQGLPCRIACGPQSAFLPTLLHSCQ